MRTLPWRNQSLGVLQWRPWNNILTLAEFIFPLCRQQPGVQPRPSPSYQSSGWGNGGSGNRSSGSWNKGRHVNDSGHGRRYNPYWFVLAMVRSWEETRSRSLHTVVTSRFYMIVPCAFRFLHSITPTCLTLIFVRWTHFRCKLICYIYSVITFVSLPSQTVCMRWLVQWNEKLSIITNVGYNPSHSLLFCSFIFLNGQCKNLTPVHPWFMRRNFLKYYRKVTCTRTRGREDGQVAFTEAIFILICTPRVKIRRF